MKVIELMGMNSTKYGRIEKFNLANGVQRLLTLYRN